MVFQKSGIMIKKKMDEILDQKDLTRWFEMTPTKEEMDETNWKSAILGYALVIFGQVIIITGEFYSLSHFGDSFELCCHIF